MQCGLIMLQTFSHLRCKHSSTLGTAVPSALALAPSARVKSHEAGRTGVDVVERNAQRLAALQLLHKGRVGLLSRLRDGAAQVDEVAACISQAP